VEPEGSLPCSQDLATGPYPEPDKSNPYPHIHHLHDPFLAYFPYFEKNKIKGGL
jgi:hypothetical protein